MSDCTGMDLLVRERDAGSHSAGYAHRTARDPRCPDLAADSTNPGNTGRLAGGRQQRAGGRHVATALTGPLPTRRASIRRSDDPATAGTRVHVHALSTRTRKHLAARDGEDTRPATPRAGLLPSPLLCRRTCQNVRERPHEHLWAAPPASRSAAAVWGVRRRRVVPA